MQKKQRQPMKNMQKGSRNFQAIGNDRRYLVGRNGCRASTKWFLERGLWHPHLNMQLSNCFHLQITQTRNGLFQDNMSIQAFVLKTKRDFTRKWNLVQVDWLSWRLMPTLRFQSCSSSLPHNHSIEVSTNHLLPTVKTFKNKKNTHGHQKQD